MAPPPAPRKRRRDRLFLPGDALETLALASGLLLAVAVPERLWPALTQRFVPVGGELLRRRVARLERICGARFGPERRRRIVRAGAANYARRHLQRLRDLSPLGWHPPIEVHGLERIEAARAAGHGAILWVSHFVFSDVVSKKALHGRGVAVHHLSRPRHGLKGTRYVMQALNPLWLRPERRNLASVIAFRPEAPAAAGLEMLRRLRANEVVSITVGHAAKTLIAVPFLDARIRLASGPAELSLATGAPLLPVFTLERAPGRLEVAIEPALEAPADGRREDRIAALIADYARRLEPHALAYPEQFLFHLLLLDEG